MIPSSGFSSSCIFRMDGCKLLTCVCVLSFSLSLSLSLSLQDWLSFQILSHAPLMTLPVCVLLTTKCALSSSEANKELVLYFCCSHMITLVHFILLHPHHRFLRFFFHFSLDPLPLGFDAFSFDPHKFAMDYHGIGFRECMSEILRYLATVEGLDPQDPLRLRIMSHLQCYASQREMALKSSAAVSSWNPSAFTTPMHQFTVPAVPPPPTIASQAAVASASTSTLSHHHLNTPNMNNDLLVSSSSSTATWSGHNVSSSTSNDHMIPSSSQMSNDHSMPPPPPIFKSSGSPVASPVSSTASSPSVSSGSSNSGSSIAPHSYCYSMAPTAAQYFPSAATAGYPHHHHHHPASASAAAAAASVGQQAASVKHYRPWGAELAY